RQVALPATGTRTISTCLRAVKLSAASSRSIQLQPERHGCGRWPLATTKTAGRRTAMRRAAKPRWPRSQKAGGGSGRDEAAGLGLDSAATIVRLPIRDREHRKTVNQIIYTSSLIA